jgi:hypothetical protein
MLRSIVCGRWALTLLLLIPAVTAVGCGGGGGGSSRAGVAALTTAVPTPNPGGTVGAIGSSATPVAAQVGLGAFQAFKENTSIADAVIPEAPGLRDRAFFLEDDGTVRVLSLAGAAAALDYALPLTSAPLPAGVAAGDLTIQDEHTALVTTSGTNGESVYLFDPTTARAATSVTKYDFSGFTLTWPAGTTNSKGVDVGGGALPLNYVASAALSANRLFVASSNLDASFDYNPGSVIAYDVNPITKALSGTGTIFKTTDFNPTALVRVATPAGDVLLVTNTGVYGTGTSSIDAIDPVSLRLVATIPLGQRNASGPVVVSSDGRRGYVGSGSAAEVYVLDLADLGGELANLTAMSRPARYLGGYTLPGGGAFAFISSVALSDSGAFLYAVNFNASELHVIDLTGTPGHATTVRGFARGGNPASFENLASKLIVRPGTPNVDFQGPSLFVATINLRVADQTITNVKGVLDSVTVDRE